MACSLQGHHTEIQYQCKSSSQNLAAYDKTTSAVLMNGGIEDSWRKARLSSVTHPVKHFSQTDHVWIMSDALEEHDGKASIGGKNITNLRFADDIDVVAEEEQGLEALVESLDKTFTSISWISVTRRPN